MALSAKTDRAPENTFEPSYDLEDLIGYNVKRAYVVIQKDYRTALGEGALAPRAFSALSLVVKSPNISQSDLARMLGIERSGLVAIIDELERCGFLSRTDVPGDRRVQALIPTEQGVAAYQDTYAKVLAHEARLLADLSTSEKNTLMRLLKKVRQSDRDI